MKQKTKFAFNAYLLQLARLNNVPVEELSSKFTVEPSVQQTLEDQIQQSAAFLTLINIMPVSEQSGQLLGLGVGSTIAGTTDTTAKEREATDPTLMTDVEYKCEQTNFDTVLTYAKLDLWAKFQDFQLRIRNAIIQRQALDRIMIGFNGVKRSKTSNRTDTLPVAFNSWIGGCVGCESGDDTSIKVVSVIPKTLSTIKVSGRVTGASTLANTTVRWIAIGY